MQPPYRDGRVHVQRYRCATCIFRPGNLMQLQPGRVQGMIEEAGEWGCIPCHDTIDQAQFICRGFYDLRQSIPLRLATAMDLITWSEKE